MRKSIAFGILIVLALASVRPLVAHGGKSHRLMGTVKELHQDRLTVTTQDGHESSVVLNADTTYEKAGKPAKRSDLVAGVRVVVELDEDDRTAIRIRRGEAPAH
jgi:hypothetical protein